MLFILSAHAQTHCTRSKVFLAELNATMGIGRTGAPDFSGGIGMAGVYGKGTIIDNFAVIGGVRSVSRKGTEKYSSSRQEIIPTATIMYRVRLNGIESTTIHTFAWVTGKDYTGFDYRAYMAPTERSFAVIGGIVGWNNASGWNVGISVLGMW